VLAPNQVVTVDVMAVLVAAEEMMGRHYHRLFGDDDSAWPPLFFMHLSMRLICEEKLSISTRLQFAMAN